MVNMEIIPLFGSSFAVYAPIITALVGVFTFFNLYARMLKCVGIQEEDSIMGSDFCHKMTSAEMEEIEAGKKLVTGQIRTLGHLLWTNERTLQNDTIELIGNNRRSDEESVDSSTGDSSSQRSDDFQTQEQAALTFRERALAFGKTKPAYASLRVSSPGIDLDSSNEPDDAVRRGPKDDSKEETGETDWNLPTTGKKYGRYG
jgi:hypothetical protein